MPSHFVGKEVLADAWPRRRRSRSHTIRAHCRTRQQRPTDVVQDSLRRLTPPCEEWASCGCTPQGWPPRTDAASRKTPSLKIRGERASCYRIARQYDLCECRGRRIRISGRRLLRLERASMAREHQKEHRNQNIETLRPARESVCRHWVTGSVCSVAEALSLSQLAAAAAIDKSASRASQYLLHWVICKRPGRIVPDAGCLIVRTTICAAIRSSRGRTR